MKNKFKIFYVSSEVSPFAKAGSLAEVSGALPKALKELGHDIRVMMPSYRTVNERKYTLRDVIRLKDMDVEIAGKKVKANGKSAFLPDSKVQIYLLNFKQYFDRDGLYQDSAGRDYPDNAERFSFFCRGCLETLKLLQWQPDIIHCNDWQAALIPVYLKTIFKDEPFFKSTSVLLTVHNIACQGIFDPSAVQVTGLPPDTFHPNGILELHGKVNFLKAGLLTADLISTVGQVRAQEIQQNPECGLGLEGVLRSRSQSLFGIVNGVDYAEWSPETDTLIPHQYSAGNLEPKVLDKQALLNQIGLSFDEEIPLVGIVSALHDEKGLDLLEQAFDDILAQKLQMVVLGAGDEKYQKLLTRIAKKYPRQLSVNLRSDKTLTHLIQAGADMLLVPSRIETGGSGQLHAMRFGTIPIVYAVGGLEETVQNYDSRSENGTGFVFKKHEKDDLLKAIERAIKVYHDKKRWIKLMKNAMRQDFSWKAIAEKYAKLYSRVASRSKKS